MKAEEEMRQMAIAHDLFCELNPKSKDTAISILRLLLVEETRPFCQSTPPTVADVSKSQKPTTSNKVKIHPPSGWLLFFGHSPIFSSHT